jgi:hypothetical protein
LIEPWVRKRSLGRRALVYLQPWKPPARRTGAGEKIEDKPKLSFAPWVKMMGGEYFFAPSIDFLRNLR